MDESEKIIFEVIRLLYPEWIKSQKDKYQEMDEYEQYKKIIFNTFQYDIDRALSEQERNLNLVDLERKVEIMKLIGNLRQEQKKKKGIKKKEKK